MTGCNRSVFGLFNLLSYLLIMPGHFPVRILISPLLSLSDSLIDSVPVHQCLIILLNLPRPQGFMPFGMSNI